MSKEIFAASFLVVLLSFAGCENQRDPASPSTTMSHGAEHSHQPGMTHEEGPLVEAGQGGFAALQEVVTQLEEDPSTDWSQVNVTALREHLQDMDRLVLESSVGETIVPNGFRAAVTGVGPVVSAIQRMVSAHAPIVAKARGWTVEANLTSDGVLLTVIAQNESDVAHVRSLGFFGFMALESHHTAHHWMIATGRPAH